VAAEPVAAGAPATAAPSLFTPGADLRTAAPDRGAHFGYGPGFDAGFDAGFEDPVHAPAEHPVDHFVDHVVDHPVDHGHGDPSASSGRGARTRTPEEAPPGDPRPPAPPSALPPGRSG
jgi:hypothetical protein